MARIRLQHWLCVLLLLLAGCTGEQKLQPAATAGQQLGAPRKLPAPMFPQLPAPAQLAKEFPPRQSSVFTEADLILNGRFFELALPNQHVIALPDGGQFQPDFSASSSLDPAGLAFATYICNAPGYDRDPILTLTWTDAPEVPENVYIGLANFDTNRWDWLQSDSSNIINFSAIGPYFAGGSSLFITVMQIGTDDNVLKHIHVGNRAPLAVFDVDPTMGIAPLTVNIDASGSSDPEGTDIVYQYRRSAEDLPINSNSPTFSFDYAEPGTYNMRLRVTDEDLVISEVNTTVIVSSGFSETYGRAGLSEQGRAVVTCDDGTLLAFGLSSAGPISDALLVKFDLLGQPLFAREFDSGEPDTYEDAVLAEDGFVYACGVTGGIGGTEGLLQKWTQAGELVWSRRCGSLANEVLIAVTAIDGRVYACGTTDVSGERNALVVAFDSGGELLWAWRLENTDSDFADIVAHSTGIPEEHDVRCCGTFIKEGGDARLLYLVLDKDGTTIGGGLLECAPPGSTLGRNLCVLGDPATYGRTYVGGQVIEAGETSGLVSEFGAASVQFGQSGGNQEQSTCMLALDLGGLRISAVTSDSPVSTLLVDYDESLALQSIVLASAAEKVALISMDNYQYNMAFTGHCFSALPSFEGFDANAGSVVLSWLGLSVTLADPGFDAEVAALAATDVSGLFEINRGSSDDSDLYVGVVL